MVQVEISGGGIHPTAEVSGLSAAFICKTGAFSRMLSRHATASMYPTVGDKDVLELPFPTPPKDVEDKVTDLVRSGLDMLEKAYAQLDEAIAIMNGFVEMAGTDAKEGHGE